MFGWMLKQIKKAGLVPRISDTERAALDAGTVWVEAELFQGKPDFDRMMNEAYPQLTDKEKAFLDGPVEEVCNMVRSWDARQARSLPKEVWDKLSEHRFFGLLVPPEYGGHGFSELAFSCVAGKLYTHSMTLNTVVLIPNSIGPSELLMHYGTKEQKDHWLPRLCKGEEIPCFALTEPNAGSDAGSLTSHGTVFKGDDGELKIRLTWSKRYITMAPVATLLGLAFRLNDPENLLGKGEDLGITCALVPTDLEGVTTGRRHDPMGVAFPNGPTEGKDVVIPAGNIIGGLDYAGRGWEMLMEALSGGRAISLPASAASGAKAATRLVGAYAALRQQFGMNIGRFEGIEEPLARIGGKTYLIEAARIYTCGAVSTGQKPSVVSAIAKYHTTELSREIVTDAMDVLGGKAISNGPKNPVYDGYLGAPIAITVEGANILTRTLIIFGQGALRCHPYMQRMVKAIENDDAADFRRSLFGHAFYLMRNALLMVFHLLTFNLFASGGPVAPETRRYVKRIKWASATFATLADMCVILNGPKLKQRGKIAGRFADALSWMYLASAVLRRYEAEGRKKEDLIFVHWAAQYSLAKVQEAFEGIFSNFGVPVVGTLMKVFGFFALRANPVRIGRMPSDDLGAKVARALQVPGEQRDRMTPGCFIPANEEEPMALFDRALVAVTEVAKETKALRRAMKKRELPGEFEEALEEAVKTQLFSAEVAGKIREAERLRDAVLTVDAFTPEEYFATATVEGEDIANRDVSQPGSEAETADKEEVATA